MDVAVAGTVPGSGTDVAGSLPGSVGSGVVVAGIVGAGVVAAASVVLAGAGVADATGVTVEVVVTVDVGVAPGFNKSPANNALTCSAVRVIWKNIRSSIMPLGAVDVAALPKIRPTADISGRFIVSSFG